MAKKPGQDFRSAQGGLGEVKVALIIRNWCTFSIPSGLFVPIPGIDAAVLADLFEQQKVPSLKCLTCSPVVLLSVHLSLHWASCRIFRHLLLSSCLQ